MYSGLGSNSGLQCIFFKTNKIMMSHRRKVLILGATGSIGKVVLKNLLLSNYQVVGIGFKKKKIFINNYLESKKVPYFDFYNCDLSKLHQVRNLIKKIIIKQLFTFLSLSLLIKYN